MAVDRVKHRIDVWICRENHALFCKHLREKLLFSERWRNFLLKSNNYSGSGLASDLP